MAKLGGGGSIEDPARDLTKVNVAASSSVAMRWKTRRFHFNRLQVRGSQDLPRCSDGAHGNLISAEASQNPRGNGDLIPAREALQQNSPAHSKGTEIGRTRGLISIDTRDTAPVSPEPVHAASAHRLSVGDEPRTKQKDQLFLATRFSPHQIAPNRPRKQLNSLSDAVFKWNPVCMHDHRVAVVWQA